MDESRAAREELRVQGGSHGEQQETRVSARVFQLQEAQREEGHEEGHLEGEGAEEGLAKKSARALRVTGQFRWEKT